MNWGSDNYNGNVESALMSFGLINAYRKLERKYVRAIEESGSKQFGEAYRPLTNYVSLPQNAFSARVDEAATDETRTPIADLTNLRVKQVVSDLLSEAVPSKSILGGYLSKSFLTFLEEVNKVPEFSDTLVTQYVKQLFWHIGHVLDLPQVPNPQAIPSEGDTLALWWQTEYARVGIYVYNDGLVDWVWRKKTDGETQSGEDVSVSRLPDSLIQHLKVAFAAE